MEITEKESEMIIEYINKNLNLEELKNFTYLEFINMVFEILVKKYI